MSFARQRHGATYATKSGCKQSCTFTCTPARLHTECSIPHDDRALCKHNEYTIKPAQLAKSIQNHQTRMIKSPLCDRDFRTGCAKPRGWQLQQREDRYNKRKIAQHKQGVSMGPGKSICTKLDTAMCTVQKYLPTRNYKSSGCNV